MLSAAVWLMCNGLVLSLRLAGTSGSFPRPLSAEEEAAYLERAAAGDLAARNTLIEHNLRLVAHVVKKYYTHTDEQDDLISIGTIGLIKAITSYKPDRSARLATYAARCVENEILMYFRSRRKAQGEVSLSETIETDKDGNALMLMDIVGVDDTMLADLQEREECRQVRRLVRECLDEREREIVTLRYGLGGGMPRTQREIAAKLGISRSYVSRIEKRALQKLEAALDAEG